MIGNNADINPQIVSRYLTREKKTLVTLDRENIERQGAQIIEDDIFSIDEEGRIRHDALKTAFLVFEDLMRKDGDRTEGNRP